MKQETTTVAFKEAIKLFSERHDNKTLDRLLREFDIRTVAKLIRIFSNEWIKIPSESKIFLMYRNKRIRDEMDTIKNPDDRKAVRDKKQELATFFGINSGRIDAVWREEKEKSPGNFDDVNAIAYKIYKEEFLHFQKSVEEILGVESSLTDTKKRPPIIPY